MDLIGRRSAVAVALLHLLERPCASSVFHHGVKVRGILSHPSFSHSAGPSPSPSPSPTLLPPPSTIVGNELPHPAALGILRSCPIHYPGDLLLRPSPASPAKSKLLARIPFPRRPHLASTAGAPRVRIIPRLFSTSSRASCSSIIPSSIMADRDVLPTAIKPSHYALSLSALDFKNWSYQGKVT